MLVERILPRARERLATIEAGRPVRDAAALMSRPNVDLLVVCEGAVMTGVVTRSDILTEISRDLRLGLERAVDTVMACDVAHCRASDPLIDVWRIMKDRGYQCVPIITGARVPMGVAYSRDVLQSLLNEAEIEDELLREYISGVGYR